MDHQAAAANHLTLSQLTATGTSVVVEGELKKCPESASKQKVELKVEKVLHLGPVDAANYPIAKTRLPLEYLRGYLHLRARTNTVSERLLLIFICSSRPARSACQELFSSSRIGLFFWA